MQSVGAVLLPEKEISGRRAGLECNFRVPAQDHYRFCEQYNPEFIDLKLESAIIGGCE